MSKVISFHSFRGGTGKSNTTANLAALLAVRGQRVGVVDTDIASPGIHVLFGLEQDQMLHSLNHYLRGECEIQETAYDVTPNLGSHVQGRVYLVPSSIQASEIARVLREGFDVGLLKEGFQDLIQALELDYLLVDTHPGLNEETLLSIAVSDVLIIVLRPDQQDYQGTSVTVGVARELDVPSMMLLVNKVPALFQESEVKALVENAYRTTVVAVLPHSDEMMALASAGIFVTRYPDHPITALLQQVANALG